MALFVAVVLAAGGLDETKAALEKLAADKPVQGELKVQRWQRSTGGEKPIESSGGVTFHVSDGKSGVSMRCAPGMLNEKAGGIIGMTNLVRVHKLLDAAPELNKQLEKAELVSDGPAKLGERAVRLLRLKVSDDAFKKDGAQFSVQATLAEASLWVAEDGTPLASELSADLEAGMLMIKAKTHTRIQREYAVVKGRLVVAKETEETQVDAMGHLVQTKQVSELGVEESDEHSR